MGTLIKATGAVRGDALRAHHLTPLLASVGEALATAGFVVGTQTVATVQHNGSPSEAALAVEDGWVPGVVYGLGSGTEGPDIYGAKVQTSGTLWLTAITRGVPGDIGSTADQDAASLGESARYAVLAALGRTDDDSPTSATGDVLPGGEVQVFSEPENGLFMYAVALRYEAMNTTPTLSNPTP